MTMHACVCCLGDLGRHHRRLGVHGRRAAAPVRRPPDLDVARAPPATRRRARRWPTCTRAWPPPTRDLAFEPYDAEPRRRPRPGVLRPAPRRVAGDRARAAQARVGHVVDLAADFRLRDPALYPHVVRRGAHRAPSCSPTSSTACPSCSATRSSAPTLVAAPGCYLTAAALALAPLLRAGLDRDRPASSSTPPAACRARARPPSPHAFCTRRRGLHRLRPARPPAHPRDRAEPRRRRRRQVLFTPHLAPMNRGILATCYARPDRRPRRPPTLLDVLHDAYDDEPFVVVDRAARRRPRRRSGSNTAHVTARVDERTGWVVALAAIDNLVKGASGQAVQCANLVARPRRDRRPHRRRASYPMSVTAAAGLRRRRRGTAASRRRGDPDLASWPPPTAQPVAAAGVFTQNLADRRAGAGRRRRHLDATGGRAAAVVLNSGNANAATGEPGVRRRRARCARWPRPSSAAPPTTCSCARPASSASRCRSTRIDGRHPAAGRGRGRPTGGGAAAEAIMTTDTAPQGGRRPTATASSSAAWPRARRCSPRTWRRCSPCSPPTPRSSRPRCRRRCGAASPTSFNAHRRRRLHVDQRHRHPPRQRRAPGPSDADAFAAARRRGLPSTSPTQMAGDAEGATKVVRGRGRPARPPTTRPHGPPARWPRASS